MKLYLIAVIFLAALVAVPTLAEEANDKPAPVEQDPNSSGGGVATDVEDEAQEDTENMNSGDEEKVSDEEEQDTEEEEEDEPAESEVPQELKDEVQQQKRGRFPQLSVKSCRILKRYGYCRRPDIARFCVKTCIPCKNKLSPSSCRTLRTKYFQCPTRVGKFYCRKECGHCGSKVPVQCRRYSWINDKTRSVLSPMGKNKCDRAMRPNWYRFRSARSLYNRMPNSCPKIKRCGTSASGWVRGSNPTRLYQTVNRKVCFHWSKKCCRWSRNIQITRCKNFLVYKLGPSPVCNLRYCTLRR